MSDNNASTLAYSDRPGVVNTTGLSNRANKLIDRVKISEGGISGTVVDQKKIFKFVLDAYGSGIILAHNHPSGNIKPSDADIKVTEKITAAGALFDINVLDHLIIGQGQYYSFADNGMI